MSETPHPFQDDYEKGYEAGQDDSKARIAALEAELDEANAKYRSAAECSQDERDRAVAAEAKLAKIEDGHGILATKLSEANAELVRLEPRPQSD